MRETDVQKNWNYYYGNQQGGKKNNKILVGLVLVLIVVVAISIINRMQLLDTTSYANENAVNTEQSAFNLLEQDNVGAGRSILTYGYSYNRNGEGFHKDMLALKEYTSKLDYTLTASELLSFAEEARGIEVDEYYEAYKEKIASALETKAELIASDTDIFTLTEWQNNIKVAIFDAMEEAFINAGIEYRREDDLHIEYQYKVIR
ncbi:MAG: hypothetical protein IJ326_08370 [Lachnospiraceae bacterium]|nr:hypothetical protein [Lachnospiraceae bacterium]